MEYQFLAVLDTFDGSIHLYKVSKDLTRFNIDKYISNHTDHKVGFYFSFLSAKPITINAAFELKLIKQSFSGS